MTKNLFHQAIFRLGGRAPFRTPPGPLDLASFFRWVAYAAIALVPAGWRVSAATGGRFVRDFSPAMARPGVSGRCSRPARPRYVAPRSSIPARVGGSSPDENFSRLTTCAMGPARRPPGTDFRVDRATRIFDLDSTVAC